MSCKDFTRKRKFTFSSLFVLIFRKSVKSGQIILNEFVTQFDLDYNITSSAYCQARNKLSHTAFKELSQGVADIFYQENANIKKFHGYRCLSFDGSIISLPNNKNLINIYGVTKIRNKFHEDLGTFVSASAQCCYDVLNNMIVDFRVERHYTTEMEMTKAMLPSISGDKDIMLFDRYYGSYALISQLENLGKEYVIRCRTNWYKSIKHMFDTESPPDQIITLPVDKKNKRAASEMRLPKSLTVRVVRVELSPGNYEVLITSKNNNFTLIQLKHLYNLRWGIETLFCYIKNHLSLENFTGTSPEAVLQDIWATILITNLESIITKDVVDANSDTSRKYKYIVNKAISFNSIKHQAFDIFISESNAEAIIDKLTMLFVTKPTPIRGGRSFPRNKTSSRNSRHYLRYKRKHAF